MRRLQILLMLVLAAVLAAGTAQAQNFPKLTGRVVDAANLLSPEQEAQLTQLSADIEKASSRQFVVATIPDLQGYPIEDYGYQLGRAWKIGQAEANNGIILIVAPNERKVRIEVGYGLEPVMTDAMASSIIQDVILPKFRERDMPGGIIAGANAIGEQMKLPLEAAEAKAKAHDAEAHKPEAKQSNPVLGVMLTLWFGAMIFGGIAAMAGVGRRGRRYRGGGSGIAPIILWSALDAATRSRSHGSSWGSGWGSSSGSSWGGGGGGGGGWSGGGGFSGGGGSFGGGGASGSW